MSSFRKKYSFHVNHIALLGLVVMLNLESELESSFNELEVHTLHEHNCKILLVVQIVSENRLTYDGWCKVITIAHVVVCLDRIKYKQKTILICGNMSFE
jgi:hypothetical protein